MSVGAITHLLNGVRKQVVACEDASVFRKETKDQPSEEVIHFFTSLSRVPFGVVWSNSTYKPIQTRGRFDIKGVVADLLDRCDSSQRQEEAKVVSELFVIACQRLTFSKVLSLNGLSVSRQSVLAFRLEVSGLSIRAFSDWPTSLHHKPTSECSWSEAPHLRDRFGSRTLSSSDQPSAS